MKNHKNETYYQEIILSVMIGLIIISVFYLGVWSIIKAEKTNEYIIVPEDYTQNFDIIVNSPQGNNNLHLSDAYIEQDFTDKTGKISFLLFEQSNISEIDINFPNDIKNSSFSCYIQNYTDHRNRANPIDLPCDVFQPNNRTILINFNRMNFENERILIKYELELTPAGFFQITTNQLWSEGVDGNIVLNLGNDYECVSECIIIYQDNIKLSAIDNIGQIRRLSFTDPRDNDHSFKLLTKSKKIIRDQNFDISFGSSLIAGSILSMDSLLIYLLQLHNDYKKDKKTDEKLGDIDSKIEENSKKQKELIDSIKKLQKNKKRRLKLSKYKKK